MPIYEYECSDCGRRIERLQRLDDPPPADCECGGAMRRQVSAPAFQFKGSGWYVTDYAGKSSEGDSKESKSSGSSPEGDGKKASKKESSPSADKGSSSKPSASSKAG